MGFRQGSLDVSALERGLNAMVQRHAILRTTFALRDGQPDADDCPVAVPAPAADRSDLLAVESGSCAPNRSSLLRSSVPLTGTGDPCSAMLLRLRPQQHVLLLLWHHSISDGWSRRLPARTERVVYYVVRWPILRLSRLPCNMPTTLSGNGSNRLRSTVNWTTGTSS